ncbi:hypothetical protein H0W26_00485 [Candidatus Dependentiae bacterium]|nr:hypothetical protein [Candidatus Dependentiae bacterium]
MKFLTHKLAALILAALMIPGSYTYCMELSNADEKNEGKEISILSFPKDISTTIVYLLIMLELKEGAQMEDPLDKTSSIIPVAKQIVPSVDRKTTYKLAGYTFNPKINQIVGQYDIIGQYEIDPNSVTSVVFSPDGNTIITGSGNGIASVWNAQTGELLFDTQKTISTTENPDEAKIAVWRDHHDEKWLKIRGDLALKTFKKWYFILSEQEIDRLILK